jgi:hypothetical protein
MKLQTIIAACLFAASTAAFAQAPQGGDAAKAPPKKARFDCSQAKDPKACEERVARGKAATEKARKACEGKQGTERGDCMRRELCAQAKDPAACEARAKANVERREAARAKIREACKGKQGEELRACVREQAGRK